jgi:hypothetical protein
MPSMVNYYKSKLIKLSIKQSKTLSMFDKLILKLTKQNEELNVIAHDAIDLMLEYQEIAAEAESQMKVNNKQIKKIHEFLGKDE